MQVEARCSSFVEDICWFQELKEDVVREVNRIRVHMGLKEPEDINERIKYFYKYLNSDRDTQIHDVLRKHGWILKSRVYYSCLTPPLHGCHINAMPAESILRGRGRPSSLNRSRPTWGWGSRRPWTGSTTSSRGWGTGRCPGRNTGGPSGWALLKQEINSKKYFIFQIIQELEAINVNVRIKYVFIDATSRVNMICLRRKRQVLTSASCYSVFRRSKHMGTARVFSKY